MLRNWLRIPKTVTRPRCRLAVEWLEDRTTPAVITVTGTGDSIAEDGVVTLREAIASANSNADVNADVQAVGAYGTDTIQFNIPGAGVHTIQPLSQLPTITDAVAIDATTQPGYSTSPLIELDGSRAGTSANGLEILGTSGVEIHGLAINRFAMDGILENWSPTPQTGFVVDRCYVGTDITGNLSGYGNGWHGIYFRSTDGARITDNVLSGNGRSGLVMIDDANTLVAGNFVGTNAAGTAAVGNASDGIEVLNNSSDVTIGGTNASDRNVISGNLGTVYDGENGNSGNGIYTGANSGQLTIVGNYIGTDAAGMAAVANKGNGVAVSFAFAPIQIGGTSDEARNVIAGDDSYGSGGIAAGAIYAPVKIQGNYIGTNARGDAPLGLFDGIFVASGPEGIQIGGTDPGAGNLISGNDWAGIDLLSSGNVVQGNRIGTDATGTFALGHLGYGDGRGITLRFGASENLIGGTASGAGNLISGNGWGISVENGGQQNVIQGNIIGTDICGTRRLGNGVGLWVTGPDNQIIGNVISGNQFGLWLYGPSASGNLVQGNSIGTDLSGTLDLGNMAPGATWYQGGVLIDDGASNNLIGGTAAGDGNTIAFNANFGVSVSGGGTGNTIARNSIHDNTIGIDLDSGGQFSDGITANDLGDGDAGSNNLQNYPVLTNVANGAGTTTIQGTLASTQNSTFRVEFFSNAAVDPSGYSEGEHYLGFATVTTDANGNVLTVEVPETEGLGSVITDADGHASFSVTLATGSVASQYVTATATDAAGNTSEFSLAYQAPAMIATVTTAVGGTFAYDGTPHAGSGSVDVPGGVVTLRYEGVGGTQYSSTAAPTSAGTYSVVATYAGDATHLGSSATAALTITPKLLEASAWSQGTINIGSNGSIVLHLAVDQGQLYGSDTVASLFNGATFTIQIEKADGSVTYGTLTSTATVEADGSITVSMKMDDALRAELYDAYVNGRQVNFEVTALANGGNYWLDEDTMSNLLNNGALKYVV